MVQEARKTSGFEVSDRIALSLAVLDGKDAAELSAALVEHRDLIADEVLATTITDAGDRPTAWRRPTRTWAWRCSVERV